jgi:hypothetical protein
METLSVELSARSALENPYKIFNDRIVSPEDNMNMIRHDGARVNDHFKSINDRRESTPNGLDLDSIEADWRKLQRCPHLVAQRSIEGFSCKRAPLIGLGCRTKSLKTRRPEPRRPRPPLFVG